MAYHSEQVLGDQFPTVLAAAQAGGEWAVASLYRSFAPAVLRYLRARVGEDAEDIASETWLDVARGLGGFSGEETAFRSWVFTIAHRRLIDAHRAAARRPARMPERAGEDPLAKLVAVDDPAGTVEAELSSEEAVALLRRLLPPDQADVVLLRVVGGLPADEVAQILRRRPGTVRVLQHRALRRLAEQLRRRVEV